MFFLNEYRPRYQYNEGYDSKHLLTYRKSERSALLFENFIQLLFGIRIAYYDIDTLNR